MLLFVQPGFENLAQKIRRQLPKLEAGEFKFEHFANGERYVTVSSTVKNQTCLVLGTLSPPDENLFSVALLSHTLKKEQASQVIALLPFLAYARHDKVKPHESLTTAWVASVLRGSAVDEIVTFDLHSERDRELYAPLNIHALSTGEIFAEEIRARDSTDATIVAPDNGAIERCRKVETAAGLTGGLVFLHKERTRRGIKHLALVGRLGTRAILVDDQLDTGATLISACEQLRDRGIKEIMIFATHGIFTGDKWKKLWTLGVARIYVTDTIPASKRVDSKIKILSVVPQLADFLAKI